MHLRYDAGDNQTEQRFSWVTPRKDVYMSYWIFVPSNYDHTDNYTANNRKVLAIWMDDYSNKGTGGTVLWEM